MTNDVVVLRAWAHLSGVLAFAYHPVAESPFTFCEHLKHIPGCVACRTLSCRRVWSCVSPTSLQIPRLSSFPLRFPSPFLTPYTSLLSSLLTSHSSLLALLLIGGESGKGHRLGCVFHSSWGGGMGCWGCLGVFFCIFFDILVGIDAFQFANF